MMAEAGAGSSRRGLPPPVLFLGALFVQLAIHFLLPGAPLIPSPWSIAGAIVVGIGLAIVVVADQQFKRAGTTVKPFEDSTALVTDGVFGISRNPMYLGMVVILLGVAMALGSLVPLLVPFVFAWMLEIRFILPEERRLTRLFGEDYSRYTARVRRWL